MPDAADIASERIETTLQDALAARERYEGKSRTHCAECEEPIPERRRELIPGVQLCVECQAAQETRP